MGSTGHGNHRLLGGCGERAPVQCFKWKHIPGVIPHISHQSSFSLISPTAKGQNMNLSVSSQSSIDFLSPSGSELSATVFVFKAISSVESKELTQ